MIIVAMPLHHIINHTIFFVFYFFGDFPKTHGEILTTTMDEGMNVDEELILIEFLFISIE